MRISDLTGLTKLLKSRSFRFIIAAQPSDLSHSGSQSPSLLSVMTHACALEPTGNLRNLVRKSSDSAVSVPFKNETLFNR